MHLGVRLLVGVFAARFRVGSALPSRIALSTQCPWVRQYNACTVAGKNSLQAFPYAVN